VSARLADLVELRLRLGWRRLRGRGGVAEGTAQVVLFGLAVPAAVVLSVALGLGSWRAARAGGGAQPSVALGAILFGLWQTWTALGVTVTERDALDLRRMLAYPIAPARVYTLGLVASLVGDPLSLTWLLLLGGVLAGAAVARPGGWLLLLGASLLLFAAATVALVALLQEVLERLARRRFAREIALAAGLAGWLAFALSGARGAGAVRTAFPTLARLRWILYPPALAHAAATRLYAGASGEALPWLGLLALAAGGTGWLAYRVALGAARAGGEAALPQARRPRPGTALFPEWLGPLFEKEVRQLGRHPAVRVIVLALPALAALVGWKAPVRFGGDLAPLSQALPLFFLATYVHLGLQAFWLNPLAWERGGARAFYLAPVAPGDVLAAKNLALLACATVVFLASETAYAAAAGWPEPWAAAGALVLELGLAPILYGLGNVIGVLWPRAAPTAAQRSGAVSPLAALAGMGIASGAVLLFAIPVMLAVAVDRLWVVPVAWAALAAGGAVAWRVTLPAAGRLLGRRREAVLAAVTGDQV
jgi:ABC-2 type transport system permease protein